MSAVKYFSIISIIIILLGGIILPLVLLIVFHYPPTIAIIISVVIVVIPIYLLQGYFYSKEATGKINLFYTFKVFKHLSKKDIIEIFIYFILGIITAFYIHYSAALIFVFLMLTKIQPARRKFIPKRMMAEERKIEAKMWKWGIIIVIIFIVGLIIYLFVILG